MIPVLLVTVIVAVAQGGANLSRLQVCGTSNQVDVGPQNTGSRIVGGEVCTDCRWMASLKISDTANSVRFCGGTIIKPMWIVTSAHCFKSMTKLEDLKIRVGSSNPSSGGKLYRAKKVIIHERYRFLVNDIALIRLSEKITFDNRIKSLTLIKKPLSVGSIVSVSGWGRAQIDSILEDHYRNAKLEIVNCKRHHATSKNLMCAYAKEKSICSGDTGGPLYDAKTLQLVGVINCVEYGNCTGHVFCADVFHLSDWIKNSIAKTDNPPNTGSSYYRPLLVCWLVTLLHPLHLFYIRFC